GNDGEGVASVLLDSLHRRNDELGAFLDTGWPARRDCLCLGIEPHRVRPVLVQIAESRALPAAESVIRQRYRDGEVDADHADVDAIGEVARGVAVPSENGDPIAI